MASVSLSVFFSKLFRVTPTMRLDDIHRALTSKGFGLSTDELEAELAKCGAEQLPGAPDHWRLSQTELEAARDAHRHYATELANEATNTCAALERIEHDASKIAGLAAAEAPDRAEITRLARAIASLAQGQCSTLNGTRLAAIEHFRKT